ncbi:MAG: VWA domain-containing protein [Firmicutes bacterium]|nr:VWA domain-containing protein [Bacillota bacterium]
MRHRPAIAHLVAEMARHLERSEGYRLGESAVVSCQVHLVTSQRPGEVDVVVDADAGQVFYHRRQAGQVVHVDVFHEVAAIDHRRVAKAVVETVNRFGRTAGRQAAADTPTATAVAGPASAGSSVTLSPRRLADYIDVQTATGGGRVTGCLGYSQGETLRRVHLTHVHLAMQLSARELAVIPHVVMAVEEEIMRQGREIRRVERVNCLSGQGAGERLDLSEYASPSDSLLREVRRDWSRPSLDGSGLNPLYLHAVMDLADDVGGLDELAEVLESLAEAPTWSQLYRRLRNRVSLSQVLSRLEGEGLVETGRGVYRLTPTGRLLRDFLARHRREIELRFKRTLRKLPFSGRPTRKPVVPVRVARPLARGPVAYRRVTPAESGAWVGELAVPETVVRGVVRALRETSGDRPGRLRLGREDLLVHRRRGLGPLDVCLVIDASASMAGPRMRAAKYLAQHLLLSTRDRVAVIVFQEREAGLYVPFTRNFEAVQRGLARIRPLGLTPLAEGLVQAASYVKAERARDPLLLLITDGIPTVPRWTLNPIADALAAARLLAKDRVRLSCVGLEPNLDFLRELAAAGRGTLHVLGELDQTLLSEIAHSERRRLRL